MRCPRSAPAGCSLKAAARRFYGTEDVRTVRSGLESSGGVDRRLSTDRQIFLAAVLAIVLVDRLQVLERGRDLPASRLDRRLRLAMRAADGLGDDAVDHLEVEEVLRSDLHAR